MSKSNLPAFLRNGPRPRPDDVIDDGLRETIEHEFAQRRIPHRTEPPEVVAFAPRALRDEAMPALAVPPYIETHPDVDSVGRISSQALAAQYESAAASIDKMGEELVTMQRGSEEAAMVAVKRTEELKDRVQSALADCRAAAHVYREEAKRIHSQIENSSLLAEDVRRTCAVLVSKIKIGEPLKDGDEHSENHS